MLAKQGRLEMPRLWVDSVTASVACAAVLMDSKRRPSDVSCNVSVERERAYIVAVKIYLTASPMALVAAVCGLKDDA